MVCHLPRSISCQFVKKGENLFSDTLSFFLLSCPFNRLSLEGCTSEECIGTKTKGFSFSFKN